MKRLLASFIMVFLTIGSAHAGWFEDAVNDAIRRTGTRAVDEAADTAYEGTKKVVTETPDEEKSNEPVQEEIKDEADRDKTTE